MIQTKIIVKAVCKSAHTVISGHHRIRYNYVIVAIIVPIIGNECKMEAAGLMS